MAPDTICPSLLQANAEETATSTRSIPTSSPLPLGCALLCRPWQDRRIRDMGFLSVGYDGDAFPRQTIPLRASRGGEELNDWDAAVHASHALSRPWLIPVI